MVREQVAPRKVVDPRVLSAMRTVPRHRFVPPEQREEAYQDTPLPIGFEATISQPYIVAVMSERLGLRGTEKVLEVGTGSGYQTAVLAELAGWVYSIEIVPDLLERATEVLASLGYRNIRLRQGDGALGWREEAPFEAILVTAAPAEVPSALLDQLAVGGRLVIPIGERRQDLFVVEKTEKGLRREKVFEVRFVPLLKDGDRLRGGESPKK